MKTYISFVVATIALTAVAYLPPVEERCGVKVEIGSFPQKIDRTGNNKFLWPLGVTEVHAGAPRPFPVTVENKTGKPISGELEVWMNDDWDVEGPQGSLSLAPGEKKELSFTGTARPPCTHTATRALYIRYSSFSTLRTRRPRLQKPAVPSTKGTLRYARFQPSVRCADLRSPTTPSIIPSPPKPLT